MALSPYPKYKESGINWIGQIPVTWDVKPAFTIFSSKQTINSNFIEKTVLSLSYGHVIIKSVDKLHGLVPESFDTYQLISPGDIIIRPTDLQNDKNSLRIGLAKDKGIITSAYLRLKTNNIINPDYGYQYFNTWDLTKAIYGYGSGLRQNLDFVHFRRMGIIVPTKEEQNFIIKYLKHINKQINKFVSAKKKLIKLLEEQKQAIIHQVVTGAIDVKTGQSYLKYRSSNIPWINQIPESWKKRRIRTVSKLLVSNVDKHTIEGEHLVKLCNYVDVYKNEKITKDLNFMDASANEDEIQNFKIKINDVLVTKDSEMWTDIGVPSLVCYEANNLLCGYHLAIIRPTKDIINGEYLLRLLQDRFIATQMYITANGVTRYGLSHGDIKNVIIPVPTIQEQEDIINFLNKYISNTTQTSLRYSKEIELIQEYCKSLIAAVVTGKVDVREAAKLIPNEIDEAEIEIVDEGIIEETPELDENESN